MKKVFFIILMVLLVVGAFLLGKNFEQKKSKENNESNKVIKKKNNSQTSKKLTLSEKEELIKMIEKGYNIYLPSYFSQMKNGNLPQLTNQELLHFGYDLLDDNDKFTSFKGIQLKNVLIKYFGKDKNVVLEDIICEIDNKPLFKYDKNSDTYTFNNYNNIHGHGGSERIYFSKILILESKIDNKNKITIKAKVLYGNYCADICPPNNAYYSSYIDSKNHQNPIIGDYNSDTTIELTDALIKENQDKIPTTTYKLIKDSDGNYELKSVTIK